MADVLDLPEGRSVVPLADLVGCVDRELKMRARVYPRWVNANPPKMTPAQAEREQRLMRAVRERLVRAAAEATVLSGLAGKHGVAHRHLQEMVDEAERLVVSQLPEAP